MVKTIEAYKELFIFVAGTTPQIITETIYALSQKKPAIYPHEIFIITTLTGKKVIKKSLPTLTKSIKNYPDFSAKPSKFNTRGFYFFIL